MLTLRNEDGGHRCLVCGSSCEKTGFGDFKAVFVKCINPNCSEFEITKRGAWFFDPATKIFEKV